MRIKQLNGTYVPVEDRLIFRFNTDQGDEFVFLFTRAITRRVLNTLGTMTTRNLARQHTEEVAQVVQEFEKEALAKTTDYSSQYAPGQKFPMGQAPALVVDIKTPPAPDEILALDLELANRLTANLKLTRELAQNISILLEKLAGGAGWDLGTAAAQPATGGKTAEETAPSLITGKKPLIH